MNLKQFAAKNNLRLVVEKRSSEVVPESMRFMARFDKCDIKCGIFLLSECGNGATEQDAINDYICRISGKTLIVDAMKEGRKKIDVPVFNT